MFIKPMTNNVVPSGLNGLNHSQIAQVDHLMVFGFMAACFAVFFLLFQHRSRSCKVVLAICLMATAGYALLQGAWPLAFIQVALAMKVLRQAWRAEKSWRVGPRQVYLPSPRYYVEPATCSMKEESRVSRLFGPHWHSD